ncbi:MAG: retroviral-like aspartic protease family protein [Lachnospiraceae bacterium]|jgi:predicted aspartyl protease|nr:retroviral-like aspartic protease family protein [Lachnospiraceae bacterium]
MIKSKGFGYRAVDDIFYDEDGHYHIQIPAFFTASTNRNDIVDFIFDTGAYLTVVTLQTATRFGWDKLSPLVTKIELSGFAGCCEGDIIAIPGLVIGGRRLEGVKVAIPHIHTNDNILGINVLEHFKFLLDTTENKVYFADNENYKAHLEFKSSKIYEID